MLFCPSLSLGVCSNSHPLSRWCHPTISSSVVPFSSCLQSFPASGSFPMSCLFPSGGQSIGASSSASVLPMNNQDWFPIRLTDLVSLQSKGLSRVFSSTTVQKYQFFDAHPSLWWRIHNLKFTFLTTFKLDYKESWVSKNWCFWLRCWKDSRESLGLQGDQISQS